MVSKTISYSVLAFLLFLTLSAGSQAAIVYTATLTGAAESPSNGSRGAGSAMVEYDSIAHSLRLDVLFSNLVSNTTAAHIHCCVSPPGNAGVTISTPGFPFAFGVTSGSYSQTFDLTLGSIYSAAFVTANGGTPAGAEAAFATGLANGQAYFNIHSNRFPGGEIRGFLAPVPLPAAAWLFGSGLLGLIGFARKKKK